MTDASDQTSNPVDPAPGATDRTQLRRRDRGKDDDWIREFLAQARWGAVAVSGPEGQPFVNTNLFVYDPDRHAVYTHTARTGRTPDLFAEPRPVCFSSSEMGRLLPADEALEFSVEYAGVAVFGTGRAVEDDTEAREALQLLLDKYAPHLRPDEDYRGITADEMKRTRVYRIDVEEWTGKAKVAEDEFEGAFRVPPPEMLPAPFRGAAE
jgi:nitroimidazol reductase NimA-like FMN-containing flavoprotein (pyridoxamine 5'-phosphate oxidase superfamily)